MNDMHLAPMDLPRPNMSRPDRQHNTSISLFTHTAYLYIYNIRYTLTPRNDLITTSYFAEYLTACTSDYSKKITRCAIWMNTPTSRPSFYCLVLMLHLVPCA